MTFYGTAGFGFEPRLMLVDLLFFKRWSRSRLSKDAMNEYPLQHLLGFSIGVEHCGISQLFYRKARLLEKHLNSLTVEKTCESAISSAKEPRRSTIRI
mmetsp:Transcript_8176/g.22770  ORF Transcript_8176/g.22770 Transcript_8176/m.22770 type:complete len:98 (+) Transcript_8176:274-567(+)